MHLFLSVLYCCNVLFPVTASAFYLRCKFMLTLSYNFLTHFRLDILFSTMALLLAFAVKSYKFTIKTIQVNLSHTVDCTILEQESDMLLLINCTWEEKTCSVHHYECKLLLFKFARDRKSVV